MPTRSELSSIATTLEELTKRVASMAEGVGPDEEDLAVELFSVERSLMGALRRLRKLAESPGR
jgi:hypothetical protein